MAYIGSTPTSQGFIPAVDYFNGNGSTVAFTLSRPVASVYQVEVVVENVIQNPSTAYTVLNDVITFTGAPLTGTGNIYVKYTALNTALMQPGTGTVGTAQLGDVNSISSATSLALKTNAGVERMRINSAGNVGIGTASPSTMLTVAGAITITGAFALRGSYGAGAIASNFAAGDGALASNTTGSYNTASGQDALKNNTTGAQNTAIGRSALQSNTTGSDNTASGVYALQNNTTGNYNSAMGLSALQSNTTGTYNSVIGASALLYNTSGSSNSAMGWGALQSNTLGSSNSAVGFQALISNTSGSSNSASGYNALLFNTTGSYNSAMGQAALQDLATTTIAATAIVAATAYQIVTMGTTTAAQWIASGATIGRVGETFTANATAGVGTGKVATSANIATQGKYNTALGYNTGRGITTGTGNTILGANVTGLAAGLTNTVILADGTGAIRQFIDSSGNVGIGTTSPSRKLHVSAGVDDNAILATSIAGNAFIGFADAGTTSQTGLSVRMGSVGNGMVFQTGGTTERMRIDSSGGLILAGSTAQKATGTTWSNPSDIRLKDNVTDYAKGLNELMQVSVKEWDYNGKGGTVEGVKGLGVIADEVVLILPNTVDTYKAKLNADDEEDSDIKKFDATEITWLMVKAIQEQQTLIEALTARLNDMQEQISKLSI